MIVWMKNSKKKAVCNSLAATIRPGQRFDPNDRAQGALAGDMQMRCNSPADEVLAQIPDPREEVGSYPVIISE
jgi:hypothetical protein